MTGLVIWIAIFVLIAVWVAWTYNTIVRLSQLKREGWSGIDVQLKRRHDLVPNLVAVVKQYSIHEREALESVTKARTQSLQAQSVGEKSVAEGELSSTLTRLFAVAEGYPELKASENFLHLQSELSSLEDEIQLSRRYYNGTARNYNIYIESFPSNLIAKIFGSKVAEYFQMSGDKNAPEVELK